MSLAELEKKISELSHAEKARLVQKLGDELGWEWLGIEKTPGVVDGNARIVRTRIPVWVLEAYRQGGWSDARLLENYPSLTAADLANAWAYVEANQEEVNKAIKENEMA